MNINILKYEHFKFASGCILCTNNKTVLCRSKKLRSFSSSLKEIASASSIERLVCYVISLIVYMEI